MSRIKWNRRIFFQGNNSPPDMISLGELVRELDGLVNEFNTRAPTHHNTRDAMTTCPHCNTALRLSETKQGHCAFCWRLL